MKVRSKLFVCCASLLTAAAFAQSSYGQATTPGTESQPSSSQKMQSMGQSQQFYDAKSLIGKEVKNTQNQSLGEIKNIVFNPQNGQAFAAINVSGDRYALVPFQALTIANAGGRNEQVILNATKDKLLSGPTVKRDQWQQQLNDPSFTQSIYSHYNLQPPSAAGGSMGGAGGSMGGSSGGTSGKTGQP